MQIFQSFVFSRLTSHWSQISFFFKSPCTASSQSDVFVYDSSRTTRTFRLYILPPFSQISHPQLQLRFFSLTTVKIFFSCKSFLISPWCSCHKTFLWKVFAAAKHVAPDDFFSISCSQQAAVSIFFTAEFCYFDLFTVESAFPAFLYLCFFVFDTSLFLPEGSERRFFSRTAKINRILAESLVIAHPDNQWVIFLSLSLSSAFSIYTQNYISHYFKPLLMARPFHAFCLPIYKNPNLNNFYCTKLWLILTQAFFFCL